MAINEWWADQPEERYWMVAPRGGTLGDALEAPRADEQRRFEWSHELVSHAQPGDTVFVWNRSPAHAAITAWGRVLGPLGQFDAPWTTRGRSGPALPQWRMPVSDTLPLAAPITLSGLRRIGADIVTLRTQLHESIDGPLYFPFIGGPGTLAPTPGYLTKVPRDLVALLSSRFGFEFVL